MSKPRRYLKEQEVSFGGITFVYIRVSSARAVTIPAWGKQRRLASRCFGMNLGGSGVHKGVDVFANKGTDVVAASHG